LAIGTVAARVGLVRLVRRAGDAHIAPSDDAFAGVEPLDSRTARTEHDALGR
jgi:hypothetical protein